MHVKHLMSYCNVNEPCFLNWMTDTFMLLFQTYISILRSHVCFIFALQVIKTLLEMSRKHSWAEIVRCRLICMLTNMFYQAPNKSAEAVLDHPEFLIEQVDLLGGVDFICLAVCNQLDSTYTFYLSCI